MIKNREVFVFMDIGNINKISIKMIGPVSYTHLDVYKRQQLMSLVKCPGCQYSLQHTTNVILTIPRPYS